MKTTLAKLLHPKTWHLIRTIKKAPHNIAHGLIFVWRKLKEPYKRWWEKTAFYIWAIGAIVNAAPLINLHTGILTHVGFAWNVPLFLVCISWVIRYRREGKRFDKEFQDMQRQHEIKMIVLDTMLELNMSRLSPEDQAEVRMRSPTGPKE